MPPRGLRQGDPLSRYLFLICGEGFSILIKEAKQKGLMRGASIDDCILFGDASCEGARVVRDAIWDYEMILGQHVNFDKSLIYFEANMDSTIKENIINLLGVQKMRIMVEFLLFINRGKEVFIKSSLQANRIIARELVAEGLAWRVGSGARVNIWNDSWLHGRENNRISIQKIMPNWMTDKELIHKIVDEGTIELILSIPIFEANSKEMMVWKYEGSGKYIVKSGYRVLSTKLLQNHTSTFPTDDDYKGFYKSLWNMYILAKIKIHIWRLINDLLPHYYNLAWRSLSVEVVYPFCKMINKSKSWQFVYRAYGVKLSLQELLGFIRGYGQYLSLNQENLRPSLRLMAKEL
ncbi:hypothetical protein J1N35_022516 [Gossypium stocksii]|uniref:Reverse transcriptase domain-containing protein n=1 Tax=Gossypium stocksii TaxID=47602 RepID=A0A9D3VGL9_9ROSI|nr:hypothetical protein J1N35_022516 [Gossypium stocksii]